MYRLVLLLETNETTVKVTKTVSLDTGYAAHTSSCYISIITLITSLY